MSTETIIEGLRDIGGGTAEIKKTISSEDIPGGISGEGVIIGRKVSVI